MTYHSRGHSSVSKKFKEKRAYYDLSFQRAQSIYGGVRVGTEARSWLMTLIHSQGVESEKEVSQVRK